MRSSPWLHSLRKSAITIAVVFGDPPSRLCGPPCAWSPENSSHVAVPRRCLVEGRVHNRGFGPIRRPKDRHRIPVKDLASVWTGRALVLGHLHQTALPLPDLVGLVLRRCDGLRLTQVLDVLTRSSRWEELPVGADQRLLILPYTDLQRLHGGFLVRSAHTLPSYRPLSCANQWNCWSLMNTSLPLSHPVNGMPEGSFSLRIRVPPFLHALMTPASLTTVITVSGA